MSEIEKARKMSKLAQLKSLTSTIVKSLTGPGPALADDGVWTKRIETCLECPNHSAPPEGGLRCNLCGCNLHFKAKVSAAECPAGKWKKP